VVVREGAERKLSTAQIRSVVSEFVRETGIKPIVFVDHLHQIAAQDIRQSDKQKIESNTADLLSIAQECDTPVVMVSIINREAYWEPITFKSFKESGSIEYDCHVVLGVQPRGIEAPKLDEVEVEKADKKNMLSIARKALVDKTMKADVRELEITVLKNRDGKTGDKIPVNMHAKYGWVKPTTLHRI
jgi:replicative DNA helicase